MLPTCKRRGLPLLNSLTRIVAWHVTWLIHLGREWCQCGCSVIYTTPTYVPEHIYPCGPRGSQSHWPRGGFFVRVHDCVCLRLRLCGYNRKWCSGLTGNGSRSLGLSTVISSRMVITYCKNKHHYHLLLPLCTVTYTPRKALDHQNIQNGEQ